MEIFRAGRSLVWLQIMLVICFASVSTAVGQVGFLSIDCGSDISYTDDAGIYWQMDDAFISTGTNVNLPNVSATINVKQMGTLRLFNDSNSPNCYDLPVIPQQTYLVRATFYYQSLGNDSSSDILFNIFMDDTYIDYYQWYEESRPFYGFEVVYSPTTVKLRMCLFPVYGTSFISALELRQLAPGMYADVVGPKTPRNQFLYMGVRVNCGHDISTNIRRYPDDAYDRLWWNDGDNYLSVSNRNISGSNSALDQPDQPPLVVMQDAWVDYDSNILSVYYSLTSNAGPVYTAAYFQELDGNASANNVRGMNYLLNGVNMRPFNSSDKPLEVFEVTTVAESFINMSFVQTDWSLLNPILNAYEIYFIYNYDETRTSKDDVEAAFNLTKMLNPRLWENKDPCFPTPLSWLRCNNDVSPLRITELLLGSKGFRGTLPLQILNLTALTTLDLHDNNFDGSIPALTRLTNLKTILLQDNNFTGGIPSFLSALPNLTQLNLDNNNFSGDVPSGLNRNGLIFSVRNNPRITNCTISACGGDTGVPPAASPAFPVWPATPPALSAGPANSKASSSPKSGSRVISIGSAVGAIIGSLVALVIITGITWMLCTRKRRARLSIVKAIEQAEYHSNGESSRIRKALSGSMTLLTLQEVSDSTKKFSKKIGEGSFGPVYYGKLANGQEVAVKVKATDSRQGADEFLNEVELLSRIHHRNLVSLTGCCEEENQQILIYAYVSNGTLREHLYGDKSKQHLDWRTRLDIAVNAARGLEYLHTDCNPRIIHRDVKSSNILLDENMIAKVADFGISKLAPEGIFTGVETLLKGTPGYFDPEYFITNRLTQKSDVYSFGVVLLEIISGRHPLHVTNLPNGSSGTLIQWLQSALKIGNPMVIVDPSLDGMFNEDSMTKVLSIAISSIDSTTGRRPDMNQVVRGLTEAIELELMSVVILGNDHDTHATMAEGHDERQGSDSDFSFLSRLAGFDKKSAYPPEFSSFDSHTGSFEVEVR